MPFDANKLYCSEVLAILLQNNDGERAPGIRSAPAPGPGNPVSAVSSPAALVLCQAVLILLTDVSVLDGCKI